VLVATLGRFAVVRLDVSAQPGQAPGPVAAVRPELMRVMPGTAVLPADVAVLRVAGRGVGRHGAIALAHRL
jgi:hypothetical protein